MFPYIIFNIAFFFFFLQVLLQHLRSSSLLLFFVRGLASVNTQSHPAVWINLSVRPPSSVKPHRWKAILTLSMAALSLQSRFLLGLVQVAGFSRKREHCNIEQKQSIHLICIRTSQHIFGQRYAHVSLVMGLYILILVSLNWCVNGLQLPVQIWWKP